MDIASQLGTASLQAVHGEGSRAIGHQQLGTPMNPGQPEANTGVQVLKYSEAINGPNAARNVSVGGLVDRVRADFANFHLRLDPKFDASGRVGHAEGGSKKAIDERFTDAIRESVRLQLDIYQMGVTFNAGLTAAQQSQSSVKSLIEKS